MKWSTEAKVGAFSLAGLILFSVIIVQLTHTVLFGKDGFHVTGRFAEADGIVAGNPIRYAGVDVGRIDSVGVDRGQAELVMRLYNGTEIPADAVFTIQSSGVMGEKYVRVAGGNPGSGYLSDGMHVHGQATPGFDDAMKKADAILTSTQKMVDGINKIVTDPSVQNHTKNTVGNIDELTRNLSVMTAEGIEIARQVEGITGQMNAMLTKLDGDGKVTGDARQIMDNLVAASANARDISNNARTVSGKLNSFMDGTSLSGQGELLYNTNDKKYSPNFQFRIGGDQFALLGAESIGEDTLLNAEFGERRGPWQFRGGIIRGEVGAGADYTRGRWTFGTDLYDLNDLTLRFRGAYELAPGVYAVGQTIQPHKRDGGGEYLGVGFNY